MKKIAASMLIVSLLLSGCVKIPGRVSEAEPMETEKIQTETTVPVQPETQPGVSVRREPQSMEGYEGDFQLLIFEHDLVEVRIPGNESAESQINAWLEQQDRLFVEGDSNREDQLFPQGYEEILSAAREAYLEQPEYMNTYYFSRRVEPIYADGSYLCILVSNFDYMGGAHGSAARRACMFSTQTGQLLTLQDLTDNYEALRETAVDFMVKTAESRPDIQNRIAWFGPEEYEQQFSGLLREGSWCLDGGKLCFFSDEYEFGPYAAGVVDFRMPLALLDGILKKEFYPAQHTGEGRIMLKALEDEPVLDRVTVDADGASLALVAEGTVYDVTLQKVVYSEGTYYERDSLWYCSRMEDEALEIQVWLPDTAASLKVSYSDADGNHREGLLQQSGKDGSYFLQETE